jgi:hypothetical protein
MTVGCATRGANYTPLVDFRPGQEERRMQSDLDECRAMAGGRIDTGALAAAGAVIFGVIGVLLAAKGYRNEVGGTMAAIGLAHGADDGLGRQEDIIKRCMAGRGWNVLN